MKIIDIGGEWTVVFSPEELARWKPRFTTPSGVTYYEELYYSGCHFTLMKEPTTTDRQLKEAEQYLRATRDVVGISIGLVKEIPNENKN